MLLVLLQLLLECRQRPPARKPLLSAQMPRLPLQELPLLDTKQWRAASVRLHWAIRRQQSTTKQLPSASLPRLLLS